jgi:hypothetical protein
MFSGKNNSIRNINNYFPIKQEDAAAKKNWILHLLKPY